jgi:hypothetical protein
MEAHTAVRRRGSIIFSTVGSQIAVRSPALSAEGHLPPGRFLQAPFTLTEPPEAAYKTAPEAGGVLNFTRCLQYLQILAVQLKIISSTHFYSVAGRVFFSNVKSSLIFL